MNLEMHIGKLLVAKKLLDYSELATNDERQSYQEREANQLYERHLKKINQSVREPVFYVDHVSSKMNKHDYDDLSWAQIVAEFGSEEAKQNIQSLLALLTHA